MESLFQEIEYAIATKLYFLAVTASLTIPDICSALISVDGRTSGEKYKKWCRDNLASAFPHLTDLDLYSLRCGVSHQGRFGHPQLQYDRVIFTLEGSPLSGHNSPIEWPDISYLLMKPETFCRDIVVAARSWLAVHSADENIRKNLERLVRFRPEGLPPRINGIPMIA